MKAYIEYLSGTLFLGVAIAILSGNVVGSVAVVAVMNFIYGLISLTISDWNNDYFGY